MVRTDGKPDDESGMCKRYGQGNMCDSGIRVSIMSSCTNLKIKINFFKKVFRSF